MANYSLEFKEPAKKDIKKLDTTTQGRILAKLRFFAAQDNPLVFAKPLTDNRDGNYRWRVGHFRIVFDVDGDIFTVLRVQHRREVYRK